MKITLDAKLAFCGNLQNILRIFLNGESEKSL